MTSAFALAVLSCRLPGGFGGRLGRFFGLGGHNVREEPRHHVFHVVEEIGVQIAVLAKAVRFAGANRLMFVDVDVVAVGLSGVGTNHADMQARSGGDELPKTVARAVHGRRRIVLAKQRRAAQELEQIVRGVAQKIETLRDVVTCGVGPRADDRPDERPQFGVFRAAGIDVVDDRQVASRLQIVDVIGERAARPAFDVLLVRDRERLLERVGKSVVTGGQSGIGHGGSSGESDPVSIGGFEEATASRTAGREFGLSRTNATHRLRLLRLSPDIREQIASGALAAGTARVLVGLNAPDSSQISQRG